MRARHQALCTGGGILELGADAGHLATLRGVVFCLSAFMQIGQNRR